MTWLDLSEVLKKKRNSCKMTQEDLAEQAEVSIASIQRLESGRKIALSTLFKIMNILQPFDSTNTDKFTVKDIYELYKE